MKSEHHRTALEALIRRDHPAAEALIAALVLADPRDGSARLLQGRLAADRGDFQSELTMTQVAVDLEPDNPEFLAQLGRCYARAQAAEPAFALADVALRRPHLSDVTLDTVAAIYARFGRHQRAAEILNRAVSAGTRNPAVLFNLGNSLKFSGDFAGARRAYEAAIAVAPDYAKAHAALSSLGSDASDREQLERLEALISRTADVHTAIQLRHAAARRCEALGRYADAWAHLSIGKADVAAAKGADPSPVLDILDAIPPAFGPFGAGTTSESTGPIFVVGMPRSGTTVVDRIVSNHSEVTSIGEFQHFGQLLRRKAGSETRSLIDAPILDLLATGADLTDVGADYSAKASEMSDGNGRTLDKFHMNFMLSGHVLRAIPTARILCLMRDPLDTVVGNFRQLFEFATPLYDYSLNPVWAARMYVRFNRLAHLWASAAPDRFMLVDYQALVADPESEGRRMLTHCGLSWEPGCERIERNESSVATASAVQVRQPINDAFIGRWRNYEAFLAPVRGVLEEAGLKI